MPPNRVSAKHFSWPRAIFAFWLSARLASACLCFSDPLCTQLPIPDGNTAILVGSVESLYPASVWAYPVGGQSAGPPEGDSREALTREKDSILSLWAGTLSKEEELAVIKADSLGPLSTADIGLYPQRVRIRGEEWFLGGPDSVIEVYTDLTSCGYHFESGRQYLVVAHRNAKTGRWATGACSRTSLAQNATDEIDWLRAWKAGHPMPPRVYGTVDDPGTGGLPLQPLAGIALRLVGATSTRDSISDAQGHFAFDNLESSQYQLEIAEGSWNGEAAKVDLRHDRCYLADVLIDIDSAGTSYKILREGRHQ
jgi:hypothetical protein